MRGGKVSNPTEDAANKQYYYLIDRLFLQNSMSTQKADRVSGFATIPSKWKLPQLAGNNKTEEWSMLMRENSGYKKNSCHFTT